MLASACLVPQSVDPESTRPHTVPLIDLMQLADYWYTPRVTLFLPGSEDTGGCHCELELKIQSIKEPDPTVTLQYRWFADYDIINAQQSWVFAQQLQGAFNSTAVVRGPVTYNLNAEALNLQPDVTHSIEFVIAEDAGFNPDPTAPPHHRALNPGWDATTVRLLVDVKQSSTGQCDKNAGVTSPPTVRVCP